MLADCGGDEHFPDEPDALPPDMSTRASLLVTLDVDPRFSASAKDAILETARVELKKRMKLAVVSSDDDAAAAQLVAQRKLTPRWASVWSGASAHSSCRDEGEASDRRPRKRRV